MWLLGYTTQPQSPDDEHFSTNDALEVESVSQALMNHWQLSFGEALSWITEVAGRGAMLSDRPSDVNRGRRTA